MKVEVVVMLKPEVLDSAGRQVKNALNSLGFDRVKDCRIGKIILLDLDVDDFEQAKQMARDMAQRLLANTTIEDFVVRPYQDEKA